MTGSPTYLIVPSEHFAQTYQDLIDRYYRRRGARRAFESDVANVVRDIALDPARHAIEPCPVTLPGEWEFRKARFWMPRVQRNARWGRLMYLVRSSASEVHLVWIYTHAEFAMRPTDTEIESALKQLSEMVFGRATEA